MADGGGGDAGQAAEPLRGCYKEGEAYILTTMNIVWMYHSAVRSL